MKTLILSGALALAAVVAQPVAAATAMSGMAMSSARPAAIYNGHGKVQAVNAASVTIAHGPISGIGWPAMTMTFKAGQAGQLAAIHKGQTVDFAFGKRGSDFVLTSIKPVG